MAGVLEQCRYEFSDSGDPRHLMTALHHCHVENEPPPRWLVLALHDAVEATRYKRPGRGKRSPAENAQQFTIDVHRGETVRQLRQLHDIPEREVYQAASDELIGTEYEGSPDAIRDSWRRVKDKYIPPLR